MKCTDCDYYDPSYIPRRCMHPSNVYRVNGGIDVKETAQEINPNDKCHQGVNE